MDQRIIDLYDDFTHGGMSRRSFLDKPRRSGRQHGGGDGPAADPAEQLRPGADHAGERSADHRRDGRHSRRPGPQGLSREAEGCRRQAADRDRHPREPGPQPAHQGRDPPHGDRRLHRARARLSLAHGRHARRRGQGPRDDRPAQAAGRDRLRQGGGGLSEGPPGRQRQGRRHRLLLGRRRGEQPRGQRARTSMRASPITAASRRPRTCRRSRPR